MPSYVTMYFGNEIPEDVYNNFALAMVSSHLEEFPTLGMLRVRSHTVDTLCDYLVTLLSDKCTRFPPVCAIGGRHGISIIYVSAADLPKFAYVLIYRKCFINE